MKKILCPTDFSDTAHNAIAYAAKFAHAAGYELILFHVQSLFDQVPAEILSGEALLAVVQDLKAQSYEVSKTFKISCEAVIEPSFRKLSSIIQEKAAHYELIVMGSNGPDNLSQLSFGSNAYKAAIGSNTPLLMIPVDCVYSEIKKIVCAFDYMRNDKLSIGKLIPFAKLFGAEITVLQVMEKSPSEDADIELKELQAIIRNSVDEDVPLRFDTIRSNEVAQSIHNYMSSERPDVLAVCAIHMNFVQRVFHTSVIKNIMATSNCPVLIFHQ
jgi:nucleotide-binding universal stress UspA family protein